MATTIKLKSSVVEGKTPTASDLVIGEIAIGANSNTPALFFKDNADNIIKLEPGSGVEPSPTPPATPNEGDLWYNETANTLNYWDGTQWVELGQAGDSPVTSVNGETGTVVLTASDVGALAPGDDVSDLNNNAGYITAGDVPAAPVDSVNSKTGAVVLGASDVGAATTAQGAKADSALQAGDDVSELNNNAGYITAGEVPAAPVDSVNTKTGAVVLDAADVGALTDGNWSSYGDGVEVEDDDLFVVSRGGVALTIPGSEVGGGGTPKPIDPIPGQISGYVSGTGTQLDPFILSSASVNFGQAAVSIESITITGQKAGALVIFEDANTGTNGTRFAQSTGVVGADGTWTNTLNFNDSPASTVAGTYIGLLNLSETDIYFQWDVAVKANAAIATPSIVAPPDGAGIGGDVTYLPRTSAATSVDAIAGGWVLEAAAPTTPAPLGMAYVGGTFAVVGNRVGEIVVNISANGGTSWTTPSTSNMNQSQWSSVAGGTAPDGTNWFWAVVGGGSNTVRCASSNDSGGSTLGAAWTTGNMPQQFGNTGAGSWYRVIFGATHFIAVGNECLAYNVAGQTTWSRASNVTGTAAGKSWTSVAYGNGITVACSTQDGTIRSLDEGKTYIDFDENGPPGYVIAYGAGKFVLIGRLGSYYSADGTPGSWVLGNLVLESNPYFIPNSLTYADGKFVALCQTGSMEGGNSAAYSIDGINWTGTDASAVTNNPEYVAVAYGDNKFLAITGMASGYEVISNPNGTDGSTTLTLTNSKTYNNADGADMDTPISETFSSGQTVTAVSTTVLADTPAFSTTLYTGTESSRLIETGVNNTGKSLIWVKNREQTQEYFLSSDAIEGRYLSSDLQDKASLSAYTFFESFDSTGVTISGAGQVNKSGKNFVAWNWRAAPGFFDVVTYTGIGNVQNISHSLGSIPGMIIVKNLSTAANWIVYHKSTGPTKKLELNESGVAGTSSGAWNDTAPTASVFTVGTNNSADGDNYVAYIFADTPGLIKCDGYTGTNTTRTIDLGFKPQWILIKAVNEDYAWYQYDVPRGWVTDNGNNQNHLLPNNNTAEYNVSSANGLNVSVTAEGFQLYSSDLNKSAGDYIYIAIAENAVAPPGAATGTVSSAINNILTLNDVGGTWSAGDFAVNDTEVTKTGPGADVLEFVGSTPQDEPNGSISSWNKARWQFSVDETFTSPMGAAKVITNADIPQTLSPDERGGAVVLEDNTQYWARLKYDSSTPSVSSTYSPTVTFKTAAAVPFTDDTPITFFDPETLKPLSEHQVERRFGVDPETVSTSKLPVNRLTNEPQGVTAAFVQEGDKYRPIEDQTETVSNLQSLVELLKSRISSIESDEVNDDAVDNSLITLVGSLSTQVTTFTNRIAAAEALIDELRNE